MLIASVCVLGRPLLVLVEVDVRAIARRLVRGQLVDVGLAERGGRVRVVLLLTDRLVVTVEVVVWRVGMSLGLGASIILLRVKGAADETLLLGLLL